MTRRHAEKGATQRPAARDQRAAALRAQPARLDGAAAGSAQPGPPPIAVAAPMTADCASADLIAVRHERDQLRGEVERLRLQYQQLEDATAHVKNRLAWAADTIQSLIDNKG